MKAHSHVGASSATRWMNCPGSVRLSEGIESRSSKYAAEGTVAHLLGEEALAKRKPLKQWLGKIVEQDGFKIEVTQEMIDAVRVYVDTVREDCARGDDLTVEHKFHIKDLHEALYGTNDASIFKKKEKKLIVYDYKHGQGVAVEVENNAQLKYYAIGALMETGFPATEVEMVIVQPRCAHPDGPVRRWLCSVVDLLDFADELVQAVKRTEAPDAPLKAGDHCKWCPAAGICPELENQALEAAKSEFGPELSYDPAHLAEILHKLPAIETWIKSVREFAYGEAEHGRTPPGWKLVEKRATRKWRDEERAAVFLKDYGLDAKDIFAQPKILSPAQIEKVIGKKNAGDIAELVVKESSGHTLAPESDKREAAKVAATDEFTPV